MERINGKNTESARSIQAVSKRKEFIAIVDVFMMKGKYNGNRFFS